MTQHTDKSFIHDSFSQNYKDDYESERDSCYQLRLSILQLALSRHVDRDGRVMNIGSGPGASVKPFLDRILPHCREVVLLEPNKVFCDEYRKAEWYLANKNKITIISNSVEGVMKDGLNVGLFDVIWGQYVIPYWKLSDMPAITKYLVQLLSDESSVALFVLPNPKSPVVVNMRQKLCPSYCHSQEFRQSLDGANCKYSVVTCHAERVLPRPKEFMEVVLNHDLYQMPDYFPEGMTPENKQKLDEVLEDVVKKNTKDGRFIYQDTLDCFVINKSASV